MLARIVIAGFGTMATVKTVLSTFGVHLVMLTVVSADGPHLTVRCAEGTNQSTHSLNSLAEARDQVR